MKKVLISIVCFLFALLAMATEYAPIMWPTSYTVKKDKPFVCPLEEIGVKYDHPIKLMDLSPIPPVTIKCNGAVVAEAISLDITNNETNRSVEGILNIHFDKQNLPKGATYELCLPEGVVGCLDIEKGPQPVNAASSIEFSVPSSLGETEGTQDGESIKDSNHYIVIYWGFETKAVGEPKFELYREDTKIAELPASVGYDWDLGYARPLFNNYMTFENGVNYKLVLPAGSVCSNDREDITNDEVIINFTGAYTDPALPFTYTWCSLYTDHSGVLGEVSFNFDRPIEIAPDGKIQLYEIYPTEQLIMEVKPWINTDVNCWTMVCDFGGYTRDGEWGFTIVIPEGAIISADSDRVNCARSEFSSGTSGIEKITFNDEASHPYYNLQGVKVTNPRPGNIYIHNGKKIIFR